MATRPRARACIFHKTLSLMLYNAPIILQVSKRRHTQVSEITTEINVKPNMFTYFRDRESGSRV